MADFGYVWSVVGAIVLFIEHIAAPQGVCFICCMHLLFSWYQAWHCLMFKPFLFQDIPPPGGWINFLSLPLKTSVLLCLDNDGVIRNRNKAKAELLSGLKNHNLCQNRHTRCKVTPKRSTSENSITKKGESKEVADSKSELKGRRRSTLTEPTQKVNLRKGKPNSEVKV